MCANILHFTDLKSELQKATGSKFIASYTGDGTATDIVMNFTDGSKLVIPKNTAAATITTTVEETDTYVKVTITTTSNGVATAESFTINKPIAAIGSFEIIENFTVAATPVVVGVPNYAVTVRVNPSNALFVAENLKIATSTYASAVVVSDIINVSAIKSVATGVYEVGVAALVKGKSIAASDLETIKLVYMAPNAAGDPIETVSTGFLGDGTGSISTVDFTAIAVGNVVTTGLDIKTNSAQAIISGSTFNETSAFTKAGVKSVVYSLDEAGAEFATIAADPDDMTQFIITPKADAFGEDEIATPAAIEVYALYEDIKGNKAYVTGSNFEPIKVADVEIATAFNGATITLPEQTVMLPVDDQGSADALMEIAITKTNFFDKIPAPFTWATVIDGMTSGTGTYFTEVDATVYKKGKVGSSTASDKVADQIVTTATATITTAATKTLSAAIAAAATKGTVNVVANWNKASGGKFGSYEIAYIFTDNRDKGFSTTKNNGADADAKKLVVVIPFTITAPAFTAELLPLDELEAEGVVFENGQFNAYTDAAADLTLNAAMVKDFFKATNPIVSTTGEDASKPVDATNAARAYVLATADGGFAIDSAAYIFKAKLVAPIAKGDRVFGQVANPTVKVVLVNTQKVDVTIINKDKATVIAPAAKALVKIDKLDVKSATPKAISKKWSAFNVNPASGGAINIYDQVTVTLADGSKFALSATPVTTGTTSVKAVTYEVVVDGSSVSVAKIADKTIGILTTAAQASDVLDRDVVVNVKVTVEDVWGTKTVATVPVTLTNN